MAKKKKSELGPILSLKNPWKNNSNSIWLASSISLYRNLDRYKFPGKLSSDEKSQVKSLVDRALAEGSTLKQVQFCSAEEITPLEKEFLSEHFLIPEGYQSAHGGEGFVIEARGDFLAVINVRNHLQLRCLEFGLDLDKALSRILSQESSLAEQLSFSFSSRFGYLTADPYECGTALDVSVYLQLPALLLSDTLPVAIKQLEESGVVTTGLQGAPDEYPGHIVRLRNRYTLGLSEEKILSIVRSAASKLSSMEQKAREEIQKDSTALAKDHVSRAYGLLTLSYQIETIEALNALSFLKLGVDLGWVDKSSAKELNALLFSCRRASLLACNDPDAPQEEIAKIRSQHLHKALKKTELKI